MKKFSKLIYIYLNIYFLLNLSQQFDWKSYFQNLIAPLLIFGASLILYYIWTRTPYTLNFKHLTLSEYTIQYNYWYTIFSSSFTPINSQTLYCSLLLGVSSIIHLGTKFKARHFWSLFIINR